MKKKLIVLALICIGAALFFGLELGRYVSLDVLNEWVAQEPLRAGLAFAVIYILVASLNLPGAGPLSLIGGAVFGLWGGVLIVSFASSIGATIAMLISRTLLQDWVQKRFADTIQKVNAGVEKDGGQYLFTLRLIPLIPFFAVNLVFGLTKMRAGIFYLVSQIGMFPATLIFVNAGASLGNIDEFSLAEVFQPGVILSFVALIAFPFIVKFISAKISAYKKAAAN